MKKRPNRKELLKAGEFATNLLKARGILTEKSIIDAIKNAPGSPTLPGYTRLYIPRKHTIEITKLILYSIAKVWQDKFHGEKQEKVDEFFKYVIRVMRRSHKLIIQLLQDSVERAKVDDVDIGMITTQENIKGIQRFLIDSFAVYPNLMNNKSCTSDYLEWFISWTTELRKIAETLPDEPAKETKVKTKRTKTESKAKRNRILSGSAD